MKVWIFNHYAGNMFFDKGGRHYCFAKYLKRMGWEPVIFCANAKHGKAERFFEEDPLWQEHRAEEIDVPFVFVKGRTYAGNGKQRVLNMFDFYRNVQKAAKEYAKTHDKPDVIYASSVHPLTIVAGIRLAKRFGVKCVGEVRDLWPESLIAYGMAGPHHPAVLVLRRLEKWIYRKADAMVFTMEGAYDYIVNQGWEKDISRSKVYYINNGVDLEVYDSNRTRFAYADADLDDPDTFKAVYTGSVRAANHVEKLIEEAAVLKEEKKDSIRILIYGDGERRSELEKEAQARGLDHLIFKGAVKKTMVPYILSKCDLCLLDGPVEAIARYGVSLNKSFEYLASAKPTLANAKLSYDYFGENGAGIVREFATPRAFAKEIIRFAEMPPDVYQCFCDNARKTAQEFDFSVLTQRLAEVLESPKGEPLC